MKNVVIAGCSPVAYSKRFETWQEITCRKLGKKKSTDRNEEKAKSIGCYIYRVCELILQLYFSHFFYLFLLLCAPIKSI